MDTIATDDVLAVLKPIWTTKAETASRMRGRIEKVLDAAKAKGFREGENPARWRGHLDHLLPRPSKLSMPQCPMRKWPAFVSKLRDREATSALALVTAHPDRRPLRRNLGNAVTRNRLQQENLDGTSQSHGQLWLHHDWSSRFEDPIPLPDGRTLSTLREAGDYITNLSKAEQDLEEWQTAIGCLIGAAEGRDFLMHAHVSVLPALNRYIERVFAAPRKHTHWGRRSASINRQRGHQA